MKHSAAKICAILLVNAAFSNSSIADSCPIPPTKVAPTVSSKVTFDKRTGIYTYEYILGNSNSSQLPIEGFVLKLDQAPSEVKSPAHWQSNYIDSTGLEKNLVWDTTALDPNDPRADDKNYNGPPLKLFYSIKPGKNLSGFSLKSTQPPGPVKYFAEGETEAPITVATSYDDEPEHNCPGFDEGPRFKTMLGGVTEGPVAPGTIPISIRFLKESGEWRSRECSPDKDSGKISILVFANRDFDPADLNLSTVKLGYGEAPVLSNRFLPGFKDRDGEWGDWEKSCKRIHPDRDKENDRERTKKKALLLTFDFKSIGIRCDLDKALFLEGKTTEGKNVVGAVPISTKDCKTWSGKKKLTRPNK